MNETGLKQRLAAILAADAVGYSRLMEADELRTAASLDAARSVFKKLVDANRGHVINMAGDNVLAIFETAAGAVTAALAIQQELNAAARDIPKERAMRFRIGIHLGDIVETDTDANRAADVYGDGVNIAARLQALADPGGIMVSDAVRGAVKNRVSATFDDRGMQAIKNIGDPIRAFAVRVEGATERGAAAKGKASRTSRRVIAVAAACAVLGLVAATTLWLRPWTSPTATSSTTSPTLPIPVKPSIAVLPFENMSGDAEQAYFADGITEDLITDLSKVAGLFVIARNSTFVYKGKPHDARDIAKSLGVRFVLEGSVRRSGANVRVNAQLIDGASGGHVWADRYDGDLKNIFGLQDTVTRNVVKALSVELTKDDKERVANRGTDNAEAYDVFLKGWEHYLKQTPEDFRAAIVDFTKAAEIDANYGRAYAALAAIHWESFTRFWAQAAGIGSRPEDARYAAEQYLAKAMRAPTPLAHEVSSEMLLQAQQHEEAIVEAKRAIAGDPNDAEGYIALAGALSFAGRPAEALQAVEQAIRLNPHYPSRYMYHLGLAQFAANRLAEAATSLERAIAMNPDDYWSQRLLLATYGELGRGEQAAKLLAMVKSKDRRGWMSNYDPLGIRAISFWYPFANADDAKRFATGLGKAGVQD